MLRASLIAASLLSAGIAAAADGIPVEPGLWEMTSTAQMPMLPKPQVNTVQECIEKSVVSLEDLQSKEMDPNCVWETEQIDNNTMKWSLDCPMDGGGTSHRSKLQRDIGRLLMKVGTLLTAAILLLDM